MELISVRPQRQTDESAGSLVIYSVLFVFGHLRRKDQCAVYILPLRCPNDVTVKFHSAPSVGAQRFSLEAFKFIADHPFVFVHCHVTVCNATDPDSQCNRNCPSSGRGRRAVIDHVTDVYSLAQGPLYLTQEKREEKLGKGLGNSGM